MILIAFIIGMVFGAVCMAAFLTGHYNNQRIGKLRVDRSTGDNYLFLELEVPIELALSQKEALLEVDLSDITRE